MYRCSLCKKEKPGEQFHRSKRTLSNKKRDGFSYYCRDCTKIASRKNYIRDKQSYIERSNRARQKRKLRNYEFIKKYFSSHPCVDCGETDPIVLDFDHLRDKQHTLSDLIRGGSPIEKIKSEIEKCEVVCANCHRKRTAKRGSWYVYGDCFETG